MLAKRVVAALDIKDGEVVKGTNFRDLRSAGDPLTLAKKYERSGIDELVLLDIHATLEERKIFSELVEKVAAELSVPFTVGGGIRKVKTAREMVRKGADKIFVNTAAVEDPSMVVKLNQVIGASNLVIAIDGKRDGDDWKVFTHGGKKGRDLNAVEWAKRVEELGAGEILLTSMDTDGTKNGFDIPFIERVCNEVDIPVIASGGAGRPEHFMSAFKADASAALAASIFHYEEYTVKELKSELKRSGIDVRMPY
ncbi:MAG: imidazole glycerol phosphate synthase subunit HisF [Thermoplasmata archaeon]